MGTLYDFHCESCGYETQVSGGEDCGMAQATTTILCADCKQLYDVPISHDAMTRNPGREVPTGCPGSSSHRWRLWKHPGPCPRCGATLKRSSETLVIWD
jgi:hypothetical protein